MAVSYVDDVMHTVTAQLITLDRFHRLVSSFTDESSTTAGSAGRAGDRVLTPLGRPQPPTDRRLGSF